MLDQRGKDLGRLIGQSSEYQALKRSNESLSEDREAVTLLRRMEELRGEAQAMIERGTNPTEEMERELDELLSKVQVNPPASKLKNSGGTSTAVNVAGAPLLTR